MVPHAQLVYSCLPLASEISPLSWRVPFIVEKLRRAAPSILGIAKAYTIPFPIRRNELYEPTVVCSDM